MYGNLRNWPELSPVNNQIFRAKFLKYVKYVKVTALYFRDITVAEASQHVRSHRAGPCRLAIPA